MTTLFDLTYKLSRLLGAAVEGTATGGSTTTIVDTAERTEADDFWNLGTAWILHDAAGQGAAPQGEYSVITDFVASTDTITLRTTLTAAVGAGDRYAVANNKYPLSVLIQKINEVLETIKLPVEDTATITVANDQTEYDLPEDVRELRQVWLVLDDGPVKLYDYEVLKSATGTANKIVTGRQLEAGRSLRLVYLTDHQVLRVASDVLDQAIWPERVIYDAAVRCLLWYKARVGDADTSVNDLLNMYQSLAADINARFAMSYPRKSAKTLHFVL